MVLDTFYYVKEIRLNMSLICSAICFIATAQHVAMIAYTPSFQPRQACLQQCDIRCVPPEIANDVFSWDAQIHFCAARRTLGRIQFKTNLNELDFSEWYSGTAISIHQEIL